MNAAEHHPDGLSRNNHAPGAHSQWQAFIRFCQQLGHGEIHELKIQNGVPVLAETVIKKARFGA